MPSEVNPGCCSLSLHPCRLLATNSTPDIACEQLRYIRSNSKAGREKDAAIMSQGMERTAALLVRPCPLVPAHFCLPQPLRQPETSGCQRGHVMLLALYLARLWLCSPII